MKKEVFTNTFRNLNNMKREMTLHHPELFNNPTFLRNLFEMELSLRAVQSEAYKSGIIEKEES
jgi:hypothetical protein